MEAGLQKRDCMLRSRTQLPYNKNGFLSLPSNGSGPGRGCCSTCELCELSLVYGTLRRWLIDFLLSTPTTCSRSIPKRTSFWRVHSGFGGCTTAWPRMQNGLLYCGLPEHRNRSRTTETVRSGEVGSVSCAGSRLSRCPRNPAPISPAERARHGLLTRTGLMITCPFDNMVAIYDLTTGEWSRWFPAPHPWPIVAMTVNHLQYRKQNRDARHLLDSASLGPSEILFYDSATVQLNSTVSIEQRSHGIFLFDDALATCSSRDGWSCKHNWQRLRTGNFPRGIATTS